MLGYLIALSRKHNSTLITDGELVLEVFRCWILGFSPQTMIVHIIKNEQPSSRLWVTQMSLNTNFLISLFGSEVLIPS